MADVERLRGERYAALETRAPMDRHVFEPSGKAPGEPQATGLTARAIDARGREIGRHRCRHLHIRAGSR